MGKRPPISIREYESFVSGKAAAGCIPLPEHTFEQLEKFLLLSRGRNGDALELMSLSARKGVGKIITAKNYIGLIAMNDGTMIEILPKIYSKTDHEEGRVKKLVVEMLKSLHDMPYKSVQTAHVNIDKTNLFEIFIKMFIDEVFVIVKHGLKSNYEAVQFNENIIKGKNISSGILPIESVHLYSLTSSTITVREIGSSRRRFWNFIAKQLPFGIKLI